jgi:hypothetical protein
MQQVVLDVVERVRDAEGREKHEQRAPEQNRAESRDEAQHESRAADEQERERVMHPQQRDDPRPSRECDQWPPSSSRAGCDPKQHATGNGRSDVARAGDHDLPPQRREVAAEGDAAFVGGDLDAIDRTSDEKRGRRVTALVHQHDEETEGPQGPGVPEEQTGDEAHRQRQQKGGVRMVFPTLHAASITRSRRGAIRRPRLTAQRRRGYSR